jgi:hypothetical protein
MLIPFRPNARQGLQIIREQREGVPLAHLCAHDGMHILSVVILVAGRSKNMSQAKEREREHHPCALLQGK